MRTTTRAPRESRPGRAGSGTGNGRQEGRLLAMRDQFSRILFHRRAYIPDCDGGGGSNDGSGGGGSGGGGAVATVAVAATATARIVCSI